MASYNFGRALLPLKRIIKEVIDTLGIDSEKKFVSSSTVHEENNGDIAVATIPRINPTSKHITVNYHWFRQQVGREFVIQNIESENQKPDIFAKVLPGEFFVSISNLLCGW